MTSMNDVIAGCNLLLLPESQQDYKTFTYFPNHWKSLEGEINNFLTKIEAKILTLWMRRRRRGAVRMMAMQIHNIQMMHMKRARQTNQRVIIDSRRARAARHASQFASKYISFNKHILYVLKKVINRLNWCHRRLPDAAGCRTSWSGLLKMANRFVSTA